jgi:hypothetical protein
MKTARCVLIPLLTFACNGGPYPAPATAVLQEMENVSVTASTAHTAQDGIGTLLFVDAFVYDENTEVPLNDVIVEVLTGWSGIYVLPQSAIKLVDYPAPPQDVQDGTTSPSEYCDTDPQDGIIDDDAEEWCSWWWDTESAQFYEFGGDYAMTPGNYQPNYMIGGTDERGICRIYLYIDSLPYSGEGDQGSFSNASFWVSIGVDSTTVDIEVES